MQLTLQQNATYANTVIPQFCCNLIEKAMDREHTKCFGCLFTTRLLLRRALHSTDVKMHTLHAAVPAISQTYRNLTNKYVSVD